MRKYRMVIVLLVVFAAAVIAPAQAQNESAEPLQDTRFFLSFIHNVQFSPIYVAVEKGYAADEGFNIIFEIGDEPNGVELIALGEIPYGMISGEQVILARANQRPIVYTYEWFNEYPVGIAIPSTTDADTVQDLAGRRVGIPGRFGASYAGLIALLSANGMTESDIQLEPIGFNAADVVCLGGVEATVVYINNEPLQIRQRAEAGDCGDIIGVSVIPVADAANMVSNGIVAAERSISENPDQVAAMMRAFDSGLRDVINNPAEAYLLSATYVENLPLGDDLRAALEDAAEEQTAFLESEPDREAVAESRAALFASLQEEFTPAQLTQFEVLLATIELWDTEHPGITELASWELTQNVLIEMGLVSAPIDLEAAFTNDFVPAAATAEADE
jgi:NitT/TauT family transport system substrate-binding protein